MAERFDVYNQAVCDYEGTSYRERFWQGQGREYEDLAERAAIRRLLPPTGRRLIEIGAGFGRLADLYSGYNQVVLLDYAKSGLQEAQAILGTSERYVYVVADLYNLPFAPSSFDTVVTVRVLHHVRDVPSALSQIAQVLCPGGTYLLEYANKRNLKAILRYLLRRQRWSPFSAQPYEFAELNYDFHPAWMSDTIRGAGFQIHAGLAVSYFRHPIFKRTIPPHTLAAIDARIQSYGAAWKLTPSIFLQSSLPGNGAVASDLQFRCPACSHVGLVQQPHELRCPECAALWSTADGIYDFKQPL